MTDPGERSRRIWKWASYVVETGGECRFQGCRDDEISHTPEGDMCLEHYLGLPVCSECGAPACGSWEPILCMSCQNMEGSVGVIVSRSSSLENDGGLLDSVYNGEKRQVGVFERKLGRVDLVVWIRSVIRRSAPR